jgi:hypothetical protein
MPDFSTEFIAQQRALADAATARPWEWEAEDASLVSLTSMSDTEDTVLFCERCESCQKNDLHCGWPSNENAAYIVSACNHYPDALAEIERQTARAEAAERERDALRDRLRWIPVEKRLPEDNEYVLGADRCWKWHSYAAWLYHHALRDRFVHEFSHWMPLPEPPEGGEG